MSGAPGIDPGCLCASCVRLREAGECDIHARGDVLAVLDRDQQHAAAYRLAYGYTGGSLAEAVLEAGEARDAVAELVETAQHMADFQFAELLHQHGSAEEPLKEFCRRKRAIRAALAREQGGAA